MSPQVGVGLVGADAGGIRVMAGAGASFAFEGVAARPCSRRQLPAGASQLPRGDHPMPQYARCRDYSDGSQEKHRQEEGMIGIGAGTARHGDGGDPDGGGRDDQAAACLDGRPGQRPAGGAGGRARHVADIPDCVRDVGQERGQVGIGPRGERLARPRAEFVPGQPAVHERGLKGADYLLAVSVARPEPATVLRSCRHRHLPCWHSASEA